MPVVQHSREAIFVPALRASTCDGRDECREGERGSTDDGILLERDFGFIGRDFRQPIGFVVAHDA